MFQRWTIQFSYESLISHVHLVVYYLIILLKPWLQQAVVLCQVEKSKEDMLNQLYSSIRFLHILSQCITVYSILWCGAYLSLPSIDLQCNW